MIQEFRIYRPYQEDKGAASRLQLRHVKKSNNRSKWVVFWEAVQQTGIDQNKNAQFAWKDPSKSVTISLGQPDIGEILAVLTGAKEFVGPAPKAGSRPPGLFHKNPKGNTILQFALANVAEGNYNFRLSAQRDGTQLAIQHKISIGDGITIRLLLEDALRRMYDWLHGNPVPPKYISGENPFDET